jgi:cytochrome c biogenesis protein CcdA
MHSSTHWRQTLIESFISNLARLLPFGYAFGAGMVTTVSPCGIAMLPAYVSFYLEAREGTFWAKSPARRTWRALAMSAVVTIGFVLFFGLIGTILSLGGQFLTRFIPWAAVLVGVVLVLLGVYLLIGKHLYVGLMARLTARLTKRKGSGVLSFGIFGIAYGVAALSCTLPIFLVVVGSAVSLGGFGSGILQFVSFALGMGFIITVVTFGTAFFKEGLQRWLRRLIPLIDRLSGGLLILAGGYILYYWFVVGNILNFGL